MPCVLRRQKWRDIGLACRRIREEAIDFCENFRTIVTNPFLVVSRKVFVDMTKRVLSELVNTTGEQEGVPDKPKRKQVV